MKNAQRCDCLWLYVVHGAGCCLPQSTVVLWFGWRGGCSRLACRPMLNVQCCMLEASAWLHRVEWCDNSFCFTACYFCPATDRFPNTPMMLRCYLPKVDGVDEVQMIVTSADRVVPHVQTVTTYAADFNEVQTIELDGDDIDEWQHAYTEVPNAVTEVQVSETILSSRYELLLVVPSLAPLPCLVFDSVYEQMVETGPFVKRSTRGTPFQFRRVVKRNHEHDVHVIDAAWFSPVIKYFRFRKYVTTQLLCTRYNAILVSVYQHNCFALVRSLSPCIRAFLDEKSRRCSSSQPLQQTLHTVGHPRPFVGRMGKRPNKITFTPINMVSIAEVAKICR